ncbi:MAG: sporulation integral membrane protein YtvI [Clostridia bacterium]|nr:sporulation integral membrane protein YtvI [Clostridia bacterium]
MEQPSLDLRRLSETLLFLVLLLLVGFLAVRYLLPVAFPFLLGWGAALLLRPAVFRLCKRTRLPRRLVSAVTVILLLLVGLLLIYALVSRLALEVRGFFASLTDLPSLLSELRAMLEGSPVLSYFSEYVEALLLRTVEALASRVPAFVGEAVLTLPGVVLSLLVFAVATVYFSMDLDRVHAAVREVLPAGLARRLGDLREGAFRVGGAYLRSYLVLSGAIFLVMLLGLTLLRVRYAFFLALLLTGVDILPVVGVGTVLVPWGILSLALGNTPQGIGLFALFAVSEVVRQVLEPRLLGSTLGVHPLTSLLSLYLGARLFGLFGVILAPFLAIGLRTLFRYLCDKNKKPVK